MKHTGVSHADNISLHFNIKRAMGNKKALSKTRFKMEKDLRLITELRLKGYGTDEIKPTFNAWSCLHSELIRE